jgi:acyl-homoserine lactone acylase PvdQ
MVLALAEMSRVLDADGRAVIVVGYESRVRGLPFYNAALLSALAQLVGMEIEAQQRRRFVSRFGTSVREDLLTMRKSEESGSDIVGAARQVGVAALERASRRADDDTRADLRAAIEGAGDIIESPLPDFARATPDGERVHDAMRRRRTRA